MKRAKPEPRTIEVRNRSYQPSRAELREDLRLEHTFEETIKALVQRVKGRKVMPTKENSNERQLRLGHGSTAHHA